MLVLLTTLAVLVGAAVTGTVLWQAGGDESERPPSAATPAAGFPEAGSSRTETQVRPDGVLEVTHWIHTTEAIDQLDLTVPRAAGVDNITTSGVTVTADGERGSGPTVMNFRRASYVFAAATMIRVRYELAGAVEISTSAAGRGLAQMTALEVSVPQPRDTRVVRALDVLSLACASSADASSASPCGAPDGAGEWTVDLTGSDVGSRVIAAVTVS